jgi:hypothetical protein
MLLSKNYRIFSQACLAGLPNLPPQITHLTGSRKLSAVEISKVSHLPPLLTQLTGSRKLSTIQISKVSHLPL